MTLPASLKVLVMPSDDVFSVRIGHWGERGRERLETACSSSTRGTHTYAEIHEEKNVHMCKLTHTSYARMCACTCVIMGLYNVHVAASVIIVQSVSAHSILTTYIAI